MTKEELFTHYLEQFKSILKSHQEDPISEYIDIDIDDMDSEKASELLYANFHDVIENDYDSFESDHHFWHYELKEFLSKHSSDIETYCEEQDLEYDDIINELENFLEEEIEQSDLAYNFYEPVYQLNGTYNFTTSVATLEFSAIFDNLSFSLIDFDKDFFMFANITHLDLEEFKKHYFKLKIDEFDELMHNQNNFSLESLYELLTELSQFFDFDFNEKDYENEKNYSVLTKIFSDKLNDDFDNSKQEHYPSYEGCHINIDNTNIQTLPLVNLLSEYEQNSLELNFNISGSARDLLDYAKLNDSYSVPTYDSIGIFSGVIYSEDCAEVVLLNNFPVSKTSFSLEKDNSFNCKNDSIRQIVSYEEYEFLKVLHQCSYDNKSLPTLVRLCSEVLTKKFYSSSRCLNELDNIISKNTDSIIIEQYKEIKIALQNNQEKFSIINQIGKKNINLQSLSYLYTPNNATLQDINATILSTKDLLELTQYFVQNSSKEDIYKLAKNTLKSYNSHIKHSFDYLLNELKNTSYFDMLSYSFLQFHQNRMNDDKKNIIEQIILPNFNINYTNEHGNNILFVTLNNKELLESFIQKGVNINHINNFGDNLLFCPDIQLETIKTLINKGINLSHLNDEGKSIFEKKIYMDRYKEELEKMYFEVNMKNNTSKNKKIKI
jgi:hypothetical protein